MLYDPKWEVQTKPDVFSLEGLTAWLEKQPAAWNYNWEDCQGGCLIGLYGSAMNMGDAWHDFHYDLFKAGHLDVAGERPHTFGAALTRARAVLAA